MKVSLWAEIRRLHEIEGLTGRAIARRLHCCTKTVAKALALSSPPTPEAEPRENILDPYRARIDRPGGQVPRPLRGAGHGGDLQGRGGVSRQRLPGAALSAPGPAGAGTRVSGGAVRAGRSPAGGLGRLRTRDDRPDATAGFGLRGGALL